LVESVSIHSGGKREGGHHRSGVLFGGKRVEAGCAKTIANPIPEGGLTPHSRLPSFLCEEVQCLGKGREGPGRESVDGALGSKMQGDVHGVGETASGDGIQKTRANPHEGYPWESPQAFPCDP